MPATYLTCPLDRFGPLDDPQGVTHFVEVGPGEVLTSLLRPIDRGTERLATTQVLALGT